VWIYGLGPLGNRDLGDHKEVLAFDRRDKFPEEVKALHALRQ
jgi:hypothetical protein